MPPTFSAQSAYKKIVLARTPSHMCNDKDTPVSATGAPDAAHESLGGRSP